MTDHAVPFHCSTNVNLAGTAFTTRDPTATQLVSLGQLIALSRVSELLVSAPGMIVHVDPSQRSTRADQTPEESSCSPTATQLVDVGQEMARSRL